MRAGLVGLGVVMAACEPDAAPPRAQWVVTLATDAPVPALGDRVLVEIFDEDGFACSSCRRAFGAASVSRWPLSFGVTPETGARRIRARLFRADVLGDDGTPQSTAVIDVLATLPPDPRGVEHVTLVLPSACFGVPADLDGNTSCDPATAQPAPARELTRVAAPPEAGSWEPAREIACAAPAPAGMTCLPGGVFILGDPTSPPHDDALGGTVPEQLVKLAPFHLDVHEWTVGDYRNARAIRPDLIAPVTKGSLGSSAEDCLYTEEAAPETPLNCVNRAAAASYCEAVGKRFPTEAEWEYAASNGSRDDRYPWGADDDSCGRAIVARGVIAICRNVDGITLPYGPVAGGSPLDVNTWGVFDLGGNLSEYVADTYQGYGIGCWSGAGLREQPLCTDPTEAHALRGGNWNATPITSRGVIRGLTDGGPQPTIGLRCAMDAP